MKLYKNVDICDLKSILDKGILSLDESGNDNWDSDKRADNATDCVYLFSPVEGKSNTFTNYGVALVEVEVADAQISEMSETDAHKSDYIEYTTAKVEKEDIKAVYIPQIFKGKLNLDAEVESMVTWCGMTAKHYDNEYNLISASADILEQFANTAQIEDSKEFNFFRGTDSKRRMIDLYEINYIF